MSTGRDELVLPPRRLPDLSFVSAAGGGPYRLRSTPRRSLALVLVHGSGCAACASFVRQVEEHAPALQEWDGRVMVVTPEEAAPATEPPGSASLPLLSDPQQRLAAALSVQPPALIIADRWGEIHAVERGGEDHAFPSVSEIEEWLRYLAVQCPECQGEAF